MPGLTEIVDHAKLHEMEMNNKIPDFVLSQHHQQRMYSTDDKRKLLITVYTTVGT